MKNLKNLIALVLAFAMILTCVSAFAESYGTANQAHTITVTTKGNGTHTYTAYQVFKGNLNAAEGVLSDIQWGTGVDGDALLTALKGDSTIGSDFTSATTAADVAKVLADNGNTAAFVEKFADIVGEHLGTAAGNGTTSNKVAEISVSGDGYYFIKDTTTTLPDGDTATKFILEVVKDVAVNAKDTVLSPDKKILDAQNGTATETKVAADSSAIGDTVTFNVDIAVPDTTAYKDHFVFNMNDQLPAGITFTGISSITVDSLTITDSTKDSTKAYAADGYDGTAGYYTLKINDAAPIVTEGKYDWEATNYDAVAAAGGQKITVVFNEFKKFAEKNSLAGKTISIQYTGVVNDDAKFDTTANENEVKFVYSNDPNHDYDGDEPGPDEPKGTTPESKTRTYTTSLKILKVDENNRALAGAEFTLTGTSLNRTVVTGSMFVKSTETSGLSSEYEVDTSTYYYLLKDGSYTKTDPNTEGMNTTQYLSTTDIYYLVKYAFDEVSSKETTLVVTTDANGVAQFTGLREGTDYTLEETHAPDGYNKIDGTSIITIAWSDPQAEGATSPAKEQGGFTLTETGTKKFEIAWNATDKQFEVTIKNQSGSVLPSTGGIGTTIFYILGSLLVLGAGIILVTKRRMSVEK